MKLWFKLQFWVTIIALVYVFFIFNDGYVGKLFMEVLFGFLGEWIKGLFQGFLDAIVDSALHQ
ncbi:hypothetical protein CVD28_01410 [Bacillus sp. M6-12]|uniref:hypothetical protein n=1 Tax=Bacillus sp. M6-12 TaxID=2054166 RepID=UPI000C75A772|nr:hypothetical protein [Bacillus sp. M6-12]PLS19092.1 hypothetical protein CVD28_01410 [Bacillus sp. M6-12]